MANKIYIEILSSEFDFTLDDGTGALSGGLGSSIGSVIEAPLLDDPVIEYKTQFSSFSEIAPQILTDIVNIGTIIQAGGSGKMSESWTQFSNMFDVPRYQKTEPVRFSVKLGLYTTNNAKQNVWDTSRRLISMTILSQDPTNDQVVITPGISLASMANVNKTKTGGVSAKLKAKLISVEIPGIIYLSRAMLESAIPTYSKQMTTSGYPLWCNLELNILGVMPAMTKIFDDTESKTRVFGFFNEASELASKL